MKLETESMHACPVVQASSKHAQTLVVEKDSIVWNKLHQMDGR